ncbi:tRNA (adenine(22)-N(1))-methyltransferase [Apilactobacillus kunkeei]|uniref:tRNA (adenine(22)-N(1))-methyltransferase n=1 Tax=Apilactobacillus kunkeei TaxID=148814 RepID=UPI001C6F7126|nr:tRNA (adenine(22)-N(1))-methyltransferase TrmK [Apilactobacillus kunkeei]MBX8455669.1 tRNA (adenine(22)-N(1))-methyltransferase TrmK [Apilactobacillus kunkeei]QYU53870.1 tRNA (adenine(22)-N(1))-methyltransferase TrmK [Apilactobacillus kunkeei]CAI2606561.1 tRNA (adenine(22)-N(1))-methyltransferase [Apilactobacillus kunkeei]CAI2606824.1 tRNA (adenine(22)-N(1))-methyltransferase [Apilactobacillus kunkeei]CAI2607711.1 tRNA (adenine(22)-N(1))-methyltransferase [Apilactobacillus kunkeei]
MDANKLSQRLKVVADFVPQNSRVADIGSDHAYLPVYLMKQKQIEFGIASEVAKGPLDNAIQEIKAEGLSDRIDTRLADGLLSVQPEDKIDCVTIAGMGGTLIKNILENGRSHLSGDELLILQPNVGEDRLRTWLMNNQYEISDETILREDGHTYEIIVAKKTDKSVEYTEQEIKFGPFLLKQHSDIFVEKWENEIERIEMVIDQMNLAKHDKPVDKINSMKKEIEEIKEVL